MTDMTLKCEKCGELIKANPKDTGKLGECPGCGSSVRVGEPTAAPPPPPQTAPPLPLPPRVPAMAQTSGFAVASLVLGILSILPGLYFGGLAMGILAIVFSRMAMSRINAGPGTINGQGLATAGLVTGIVGLSLSVLVILIFGAIAGVGLAIFAALFKAMVAGMPK